MLRSLLDTVQLLDGSAGFRIVRHLHEAEALGTAGVTIHDDLDGVDGAMVFEDRTKLVHGIP